MKKFTRSIAFFACALVALWGCSPEGVAPGGKDSAPGLAGAVGDAHPALDTICQKLDTIFLVREDDGSLS
ncbi:MAG: hypothetical protein U0176_03060 [Bacteroidia bacterium]